MIVGGSFGIVFSCLLTQQQVEMIGLDTTVMRAVAGISMEVWLGRGLEMWPRRSKESQTKNGYRR